MELVEGDGLLGELEGAAGVAAGKAVVAGALQAADEGGVQAVDVSVGPGVVAALQRFATPEPKGCFERLRLAVAVRVVADEERVELVEVDVELSPVIPFP